MTMVLRPATRRPAGMAVESASEDVNVVPSGKDEERTEGVLASPRAAGYASRVEVPGRRGRTADGSAIESDGRTSARKGRGRADIEGARAGGLSRGEREGDRDGVVGGLEPTS